jgi:hypothetical protein
MQIRIRGTTSGSPSSGLFGTLPIVVCSIVMLNVAHAADTRQLASMPVAAQDNLRLEMLDNLLALNEILTLVGAGKLQEAGEVAEQRLGRSAQGKNRSLPFEARPGPHMPPAMHAIGMEGHGAASEFAKVAKSGDRDAAMALLPKLTSTCVACHFAWRTK